MLTHYTQYFGVFMRTDVLQKGLRDSINYLEQYNEKADKVN